MRVYAALFRDGAPFGFASGEIHHLNGNVSEAVTWREISRDIITLEDVPPLASLSPHPDLIGPG